MHANIGAAVAQIDLTHAARSSLGELLHAIAAVYARPRDARRTLLAAAGEEGTVDTHTRADVKHCRCTLLLRVLRPQEPTHLKGKRLVANMAVRPSGGVRQLPRSGRASSLGPSRHFGGVMGALMRASEDPVTLRKGAYF